MSMYRISNMPGLTDEQRRELIALAGGEDWESSLDSFERLRLDLLAHLDFMATAKFVAEEPQYSRRNVETLIPL